MAEPYHPFTAEGMVWRSPDSARDMLARYQQAGKSLLHVVWDWDGTIVPEQGNTWHAMRNALPPEGQAAHRALYRQYKPLEDAGTLTSAKEREWSAKALALHVTYQTPVKALEREAAKVHVRRYAPAAFAACERAGVPVVVLSAGVRDVIAMAVNKHNMHPTVILGAELQVADGRIVGWQTDSLVDANTKREMGHPSISDIRERHPHAILFGDQPQDAGMLAGTALRIRVNGEHTIGTTDWEAYVQESWQAGYDCMITDDHLLTAAKLHQWLIEGA